MLANDDSFVTVHLKSADVELADKLCQQAMADIYRLTKQWPSFGVWCRVRATVFAHLLQGTSHESVQVNLDAMVAWDGEHSNH